MGRQREWLGAFVVAGALVLAACSSGSSTNAVASSGPALPSAAATSPPATTTQGVNPGGDFCTGLKAEKANLDKLSKTLGTAIASKDYATTKQTLQTYFGATMQAIAQVEALMSDAPANVKAALNTVNQYISQFQSAIASSTSLQQLGTSMAALGNTSQLKGAGKVLSAYTKAQCGDIASPTP